MPLPGGPSLLGCGEVGSCDCSPGYGGLFLEALPGVIPQVRELFDSSGVVECFTAGFRA